MAIRQARKDIPWRKDIPVQAAGGTLTRVEHAVVRWVGRYHTERLLSALDHHPPEEFEAAHYRSLATPNAP